MFKATEQAIDTANDALADLIDEKFEGRAYEEVLALAIGMAIDEFDAEQESDGSWTDCTPYADCARRAEEHWQSEKEEAHVTMMDDKAHALEDQRAGL